MCLQAKLAPLLARANLVIAKDIEWASIMFAFEQVTYVHRRVHARLTFLFWDASPFLFMILYISELQESRYIMDPLFPQSVSFILS
jgi:hypothetical protein